MQITIYRDFGKRNNSTLRPTGGTVVNVVLKNATDIENPTFLMAGITLNINYVKWDTRYYNVTSVSIVNNAQTMIECTEDHAATFRDDILGYEGYVLASSNPLYDRTIDSGAFTQRYRYEETKIAHTLAPNISAPGCYLLRTSGSNGIYTYALTQAQLNSVMTFMYSDSMWDRIKDLGANVVFDPFSHILSLKWMPIAYDHLKSSSTQTVRLGNYNTEVLGNIASESVVDYFDINLPASAYNDYRKASSSWTSMSLYITGVGMVSLDPMLNNYSTIKCMRIIDTDTGQAEYRLTYPEEIAQDKGLITTLSGMIACDLQISNQQPNLGQFTSSVVGTIAGIAGAVSTGGAAAAISAGAGAVTGLSSAVGALTKGTETIKGSVGNRASLYNFDISVTMTQMMSADDDFHTYTGRSEYIITELNELYDPETPVYVRCYEPNIALPGLSSERDAVNMMLASGIFLE